MDIGKELRVIEVDETAVSPSETEEVLVEAGDPEPAHPYPKTI